MIYDREKMAGARALRLWQEGVDLTCPVCGTELSMIPEGLSRTEMPLGLFCPENKQHVYVYGETRAALESVRSVIRNMPPKDGSER